jgi:hypothetical protein
MASEPRSPSTISSSIPEHWHLLSNVTKGDVFDDLLAVGQEEKLVCNCLQTCIVMRHEDFDDGQLFHAVARYCKVQQDGTTK